MDGNTEEASRLLSLPTDVQETPLEPIIEALADGVLGYDAEGRVCLINAAARRILDLPLDAPLVGLSYRQLAALLAHRFTDVASARAAVRPADSADDGPAELELVNPLCWLRVVRLQVDDRRGRQAGRLVLLQDWTELKLQEQMQAERLMLVAHDLKTPLTNIKAYTQLTLLRLKRWPTEPSMSAAGQELLEQALGYLQTVNEQADKLTGLISELLESSRSEPCAVSRALPGLEPEAGQTPLADGESHS